MSNYNQAYPPFVFLMVGRSFLFSDCANILCCTIGKDKNRMKKAEMYSLLSMSNKAKGLYSITCFRKNLLPELNILYDLVSVRSTIHYEQKPDMRLPPNNLKLRRARNESSTGSLC